MAPVFWFVSNLASGVEKDLYRNAFARTLFYSRVHEPKWLWIGYVCYDVALKTIVIDGVIDDG